MSEKSLIRDLRALLNRHSLHGDVPADALDALLDQHEVRAGVVAEEPEWEYLPALPVGSPPKFKRTKAVPAGPWVPVKQEGAHEGHKIVEIPTYASSLIGRRCATCDVELDPRRATDD